MIYEVQGDILLTAAQAIAHGVAPNDHFDQGLALALREQYPAMAKDFRHYAHQCHPQPGELWEWAGVGGVRVFCLLTQTAERGHGGKPGRATLATVNHCLRRLRHELTRNDVKSLALPRLAAGVGGLEWEQVYPLITEHLSDLPVPVYVYSRYVKGVAANEPIPVSRRSLS
ncbi:macro domain-containing protein [Limnoglobus roseus]|uniref:Appr-1-p processing protein n=1 Tax=Limnoglobus roseus TaxID=2598579 RepID=A0A5C1AEU6_9BACT|nr:macro domain-containing protein [Limnoglobus roseus]QEL16733.1 Appr-1-p processing protein [Limnoglobus roseus]